MSAAAALPASAAAHDADPGRERTLALALVSHTNAGKTTLARTLLGRDIGEVRDAPHVTEFSDVHVLVETPAGERLTLWDTPGFGDSVRLARRLRGIGNPLVRFLAEHWDRWRDRPLWASQQALRTVRDQADALLYLVNAAESIDAAGYVRPEMEILGWIGKPVIVLLNQLGAPRPAGEEVAEVARWRAALAPFAVVRAVLPLDAFARCWVQELTLLDAVAAALPEARRPLMRRLAAAWRERRLATFDASMQVLAASLGRIATATALLPVPGRLADRLRGAAISLGQGLGVGGDKADGATAAAERELAAGLSTEVTASTRALLELHGLSGRAESEILDRLAGRFDRRVRVDEQQAAAWGGVVTGALAGLKADLLSGGLTMGGGMVAGGLLGALGGAGFARAVNRVRGTDRSSVAWNAGALDAMVEAALLRYLAVAHFGRGRGDWQQGEAPPHWPALVAAALAPQRAELDAIWALRGTAGDAAAAAAANAGKADRSDAGGRAGTVALALEPLLRATARRVLGECYPATRIAAAPAAGDASEKIAAGPQAGAV